MKKPAEAHLKKVHRLVYIPYTGYYAACCQDDFSHDGFTHRLTKVRKLFTCKKCRAYRI